MFRLNRTMFEIYMYAKSDRGLIGLRAMFARLFPLQNWAIVVTRDKHR